MKPLLITLAMLRGGDAALTHVALVHGAHEQILSQNPWKTDAMIAGEVVGEHYCLRWLDRHGHPKLARVIGWTSVGILSGVLAHNAVTLQRLRQ